MNILVAGESWLRVALALAVRNESAVTQQLRLSKFKSAEQVSILDHFECPRGLTEDEL
jgi:hypothetical protein